MSRINRILSCGLVFVSFLAVAAIQSWPLPAHLSSHLTGDPGGDTGVYVWNNWVFSHEVLVERKSPFSTGAMLGLTEPVDLSLHNYTVFANVLAMALQPMLGVVAAFNVVYLINVALAGLGMFVLARHVWGAGTLRTSEAWLAGLLFACSPFLIARSTAHFSLVAAAPLPFFVVCFDRAWQRSSLRDAALAGVCLAWAAYCDPYYLVYCVMLGTLLAAWRTFRLTIHPRAPRPRWVPFLDIPMGLLLVAMAGTAFGGGAFTLGSVTVSMRSLHNPVLLLTCLATARLVWITRPRLEATWTGVSTRFAPMLVMGALAGALMSPQIVALVNRALDGRMVSPPVFWRSSAPGVDVAALFLPNPTHALAPDSLVRWVASQPGRFEENVASIPWVVLVVLVAAWLRAHHRPDALWASTAVFFAALSLGPFVRIAGIETFVPTPWALLRYLPVVSQARMPARFSVLVVMAVAVLFVGALVALRRRYPAQQRLLVPVIAAVLAFELLPAPRRLHSAHVPVVFETIARDPRPMRVLNLPFGIRDGLSSLGSFSPASLFHQTQHGKELLGGYLSRVSDRRKAAYLGDPVIAVLLAGSAGEPLTAEQVAAARASAPDFRRRAAVGWVVINERLTSLQLQAVAIDLFQLTLEERHEGFALYTPRGTAD
jgi:hypothetical protein